MRASVGVTLGLVALGAVLLTSATLGSPVIVLPDSGTPAVQQVDSGRTTSPITTETAEKPAVTAEEAPVFRAGGPDWDAYFKSHGPRAGKTSDKPDLVCSVDVVDEQAGDCPSWVDPKDLKDN